MSAQETCPTCGARVVVVTGGEGTSHYRPLHDEHYVEDLVRHRARDLAADMVRAAGVTGGQIPPAGPGGPNHDPEPPQGIINSEGGVNFNPAHAEWQNRQNAREAGTLHVGYGVWRDGQLIYAVRVDEAGGIVIDPLRDVRADGDLSWTLRDGDRIVPMSLTPS